MGIDDDIENRPILSDVAPFALTAGIGFEVVDMLQDRFAVFNRKQVGDVLFEGFGFVVAVKPGKSFVDRDDLQIFHVHDVHGRGIVREEIAVLLLELEEIVELQIGLAYDRNGAPVFVDNDEVVYLFDPKDVQGFPAA